MVITQYPDPERTQDNGNGGTGTAHETKTKLPSWQQPFISLLEHHFADSRTFYADEPGAATKSVAERRDVSGHDYVEC